MLKAAINIIQMKCLIFVMKDVHNRIERVSIVGCFSCVCIDQTRYQTDQCSLGKVGYKEESYIMNLLFTISYSNILLLGGNPFPDIDQV